MLRIALTLAVGIALACAALSAPCTFCGVTWIGDALLTQNAQDKGLIVESVEAGSSGEKAGIEAGDRLLTYDGKQLTSPAKLKALEDNTFGPQRVELRLMRGEETLTVEVPLRTLGVKVRPNLSPDVLKLYSDGMTSLDAGATDEAIVKWIEVANAVEKEGDKSSSAWFHRRIADVLFNQGKWAESHKANTHALELLSGTGIKAAKAEVLSALGRCVQKLNDFAAATDWYTQASDANEEAGFEKWLASSQTDLGIIAYYQEKLDIAEKHFKRALLINLRLAPESLHLARSFNNMGAVALERGDIPAAEDHIKHALAINELLAPGSIAVAAGFGNLGNIAYLKSDMEAAGEYYRSALAIHEKLLPNSITVAASLNNLGNVAHELGELSEAEEYFRSALAIQKSHDPDSLDVAGSLNGLGSVASDRGNLKGAEEYYESALAIGERLPAGSLTLAASLNNLGNLAQKRGDLQGAKEFHQSALAIREQIAPNSLDVATSLHNLGTVASENGDLQDAEGYFQSALAIIEGLTPGSLGVADVLNSLGNIASKGGDLLTAEQYNKRALAIRERWAPKSLGMAASLNNLGAVVHRLGDLQAAENYHRRALEIEEKIIPNSLEVAESLSNLGAVLGERGDLVAAEEYHRRALAIRESRKPESLVVASSLANLGVVASERGNLDIAEDYYRRALAINQLLDPDSPNVATNLNLLGTVAGKCDEPGLAEEYFKGALAIFDRLAPNSLEVAVCLLNLGAVAHDLGKLKRAEEYHRRGLAIFERLAPDSLTVANSLNNLALTLSKAGNVAAARQYDLQAVEIIESKRHSIRSPDARSLLLGSQFSAYTRLVRAHMASADETAAFDIVERSRARGLLDMISERSVNFTADAPEELLKQQDELATKRASAYSMLAKMAGKFESNEAATLRAEIESLKVRQRELDAEFRKRSSKYASIHYTQPLDLEKAQRELDEGTLLLSYFIDEKETYLFSLPGGEDAWTRRDHGLKVYRIAVEPEDLRELVEGFRSEIVSRRDDVVQRGVELYDLLIQPAELEVMSADRILICPDGPLHSLPFAALVAENDEDSSSLESVHFFGEDKPLHTIVSMTVYAETRGQREDASREHKYDLLAFANPDYRQYPPGMNLIPLPSTEEQLVPILNLYRGTAAKRVQGSANESEVFLLAPQARILHFACHGLLDDQDPLASYLALTPSGEDDGLLQAWEIFEKLRLNADLVVLSACETGLGETTRHEGVVGLTRALQYAGARSIVVSLWSVQASSTTELMRAFYTELQAGAPKDVALQRAMAKVRSDTRWRHPFYWAPFQLVGDWRQGD